MKWWFEWLALPHDVSLGSHLECLGFTNGSMVAVLSFLWIVAYLVYLDRVLRMLPMTEDSAMHVKMSCFIKVPY